MAAQLAEAQAQLQAAIIERDQLKEQLEQLQQDADDLTRCNCATHCPECGTRLRTLDLGEVM